MSRITDDPNDPRLSHGVDTGPVEQAEAYLVLPEAERAKGFVRPVRHAYRHIGPPGPEHVLRDLTQEERERYLGSDYVKFEDYPDSLVTGRLGRYWTQEQLDAIGRGCHAVTTMGTALAETYARQPSFYGATYCVTCRQHLPVNEFEWVDDAGATLPGNPRVGS